MTMAFIQDIPKRLKNWLRTALVSRIHPISSTAEPQTNYWSTSLNISTGRLSRWSTSALKSLPPETLQDRSSDIDPLASKSLANDMLTQLKNSHLYLEKQGYKTNLTDRILLKLMTKDCRKSGSTTNSQ